MHVDHAFASHTCMHHEKHVYNPSKAHHIIVVLAVYVVFFIYIQATEPSDTVVLLQLETYSLLVCYLSYYSYCLAKL